MTLRIMASQMYYAIGLLTAIDDGNIDGVWYFCGLETLDNGERITYCDLIADPVVSQEKADAHLQDLKRHLRKQGHFAYVINDDHPLLERCCYIHF